jgi:hypothetical protein
VTTELPNAYDPPKWEPTRRADDEGPLSLGEAVGQSLGAASACWENLAGAGVFDSTRCGEVYEWLMAYLSDWGAEIRKQANEATAAKARAAIAHEIARGPDDHNARLASGTDDPYEGYGPCFCLGCIGSGPCEHAAGTEKG